MQMFAWKDWATKHRCTRYLNNILASEKDLRIPLPLSVV
jgi:hypothetical protein